MSHRKLLRQKPYLSNFDYRCRIQKLRVNLKSAFAWHKFRVMQCRTEVTTPKRNWSRFIFLQLVLKARKLNSGPKHHHAAKKHTTYILIIHILFSITLLISDNSVLVTLTLKRIQLCVIRHK